MVTVREAEPADAPRVRDVQLASIRGLGGETYDPEQVAAWAHDRSPADYPVGDPDVTFLVAEREGDLSGFGWLRAPPDDHLTAAVDGELTALYVAPDAAGRGVGTRLCRALEARARRRDLDSLGLWASLNAVGFYRRMGYERVTEHTTEFADGVEGRVVEMRTSLEGGDSRPTFTVDDDRGGT